MNHNTWTINLSSFNQCEIHFAQIVHFPRHSVRLQNMLAGDKPNSSAIAIHKMLCVHFRTAYTSSNCWHNTRKAFLLRFNRIHTPSDSSIVMEMVS
jgi:hypothetical protein